jgi:hypothetical protein
MTDRQLLELAAKATGLNWITDCVWVENGFYSPLAKHERIAWNPLTDDGDALRLAVKLKMTTSYVANETWPDVIAITGHQITEQVGSNPYAATRRAIVRAAAEIGRNM